jgi:hypothetical protein
MFRLAIEGRERKGKMMVTSLRSFDQHANSFQICPVDPGEPVHLPIKKTGLTRTRYPYAYCTHTILSALSRISYKSTRACTLSMQPR